MPSLGHSHGRPRKDTCADEAWEEEEAWRRQHAQCVWQAIQFTALLALHYDRCPVDFQMCITMEE